MADEPHAFEHLSEAAHPTVQRIIEQHPEHMEALNMQAQRNANVDDIAASVREIVEAVRAVDPDDDDLLLDMLEGETSALEVMDRLIEMDATCASYIAANKIRRTELQDRNTRLEARSKACRAGMAKLLDMTGIRKIERPVGTVSLRSVAAKLIEGPVEALPSHLTRTKIEPDKDAIKDALKNDESVPGWQMSNGGETISVRRK